MKMKRCMTRTHEAVFGLCELVLLEQKVITFPVLRLIDINASSTCANSMGIGGHLLAS